MYCIFLYTPTPNTKMGIKNDVTEMLHLLTFQSINNAIVILAHLVYQPKSLIQS